MNIFLCNAEHSSGRNMSKCTNTKFRIAEDWKIGLCCEQKM